MEDGAGYISIYKEPEPGAPYCIGGDTSGDGSDYFVGQVIDNRDGQQVATLRHQFDEDIYARQMYCLGKYYNNALIAVEVNFSTHPVKELARLGYTHQYVREVEDDYRGRLRHSFGFRTDKATRPNMIALLVSEAREDITKIVDRDTLLEMLTFIRDENTRPVAQDGAHDDCVMALGIAHYIRPHQTKEIEGNEHAAPVAWTKDMFEDYDAATAEEREMLLRVWKNPF